MDDDLKELLCPEECALIVFECHEGVLGERSFLPGLAAAARAIGLVSHVAALAERARSAGVPVVYCVRNTSPNGAGDASNLPLLWRLRARGAGASRGPDLGGIVDGLRPEPDDIVLARDRGLTGFHGTGLDDLLVGAAVRTVVLTGVSLNLGVLGTAIEAANRGYRVVVATDCVASDPIEYAARVLRDTLRHIAFLATSEEIRAAWPVDDPTGSRSGTAGAQRSHPSAPAGSTDPEAP